MISADGLIVMNLVNEPDEYRILVVLVILAALWIGVIVTQLL